MHRVLTCSAAAPLCRPRRHKGALQVDVVEAKDLPRMDTVGLSECSAWQGGRTF